MSESPQFPPLFSGEVVAKHTDPFDKAVSRAIAGVDSGTIFYSNGVETLRGLWCWRRKHVGRCYPSRLRCPNRFG